MQQLIYYRLSASSILVAKGGVCKLSGFGFQKEITEGNIYEKVINIVREIQHMDDNKRIMTNLLVDMITIFEVEFVCIWRMDTGCDIISKLLLFNLS